MAISKHPQPNHMKGKEIWPSRLDIDSGMMMHYRIVRQETAPVAKNWPIKNTARFYTVNIKSRPRVIMPVERMNRLLLGKDLRESTRAITN